MKVNIKDYEDLKIYKDYVLRYEHWIMDLSNHNVQKNITQNFEKAKNIENQFSNEELAWLYGYAFSNCGTVRHNDNGTIFVSLNLQRIYEKFKNKLQEILPGCENSPVVGGNFFITPSQYGLHNDSTRFTDWQNTLEKTPIDNLDRKYVPWRNVIIPLWTCPSDITSHAVFFDQRHVDFAHVYNHGMKTGEETATTYPIVSNHEEIDFYLLNGKLQEKKDNLKEYDKNHYNNYLYYTPYRRLSGLTPELTCEWTPGSVIVFDAFQLHATNKGFKNKQWNNKMGLLLTFLREVK